MTTIKMKALSNHPFGTGVRETGEEYDATEQESAVLIALGWSEKAKEKAHKAEHDEKPAKPKHEYNTRALKAGK